jgi:hypothetical protein
MGGFGLDNLGITLGGKTEGVCRDNDRDSDLSGQNDASMNSAVYL